MPREGICTAGVWLIDFIKTIDHFPAPDGLSLIKEVLRSNGGGAFNVAIDLAKLGATFPISGLGLIGADAEGEWIVQRCCSAGINTSGLARSTEFSTAFTDVMTEQVEGRRTFFYAPGSNAQLKINHFENLEKLTSRIFFLGYPGLLPGLDFCDDEGRSDFQKILERATQQGMTTAVDCVSSPSANWALIAKALPQIDLLFLNAWEAARLLGYPTDGARDLTLAMLSTWARKIIGQGVRQCVVIHTKDAAIAVTPAGESWTQEAVRVPPNLLRGTCGAGDALAAGFLFAVHQGMNFRDALELGSCAAATCVMHASASEGILPADQSLAFGRKLGFRKF